MSEPIVGTIVYYRLTANDSEEINRRRTSSGSVRERLKRDQWTQGTQAHIGNDTREGEILPLVIVRVWPNEFGTGFSGINGQVLLDGNDTFWVTSIQEGDGKEFGKYFYRLIL